MTTNLSRNHRLVVAWQIDNFAERFDNSIPDDEWVSDPYAFDTYHRGRFEFLLKFKPKVLVGSGCSLEVKLVNCPPETSIQMKWSAWLEDDNRTRSSSKINKIRFSASKFEGWSTFLTTQELESFRMASTVFVCIKQPYNLKKIEIPSAEPTSFRWPIDDFKNRFRSAQFNKCWKSENFDVGGLENVKFFVRFYPKGVERVHRNHCGLFLHVGDLAGRSSVHVQFELWLERADGEQTRNHAANWVYKKAMKRGCSLYMTQKKFEEFASNGPFSTCCTVWPFIEPVESISPLVQCPVVPISLPQAYGLSANYFDLAEFSDVEVRGKQLVFKVSKLILSAHSTVFCWMLSHLIKEEEPGVVEILDIDDRLLEAMFRYMYTGKVVNLDEIARDLLPVADRYKFLSLIETCTNSIVDNLNVDRSLSTLELTFRHGHLLDFNERVVGFARRNFKAIMQLPEWKDFVKQNPEIVTALFKTFV